MKNQRSMLIKKQYMSDYNRKRRILVKIFWGDLNISFLSLFLSLTLSLFLSLSLLPILSLSLFPILSLSFVVSSYLSSFWFFLSICLYYSSSLSLSLSLTHTHTHSLSPYLFLFVSLFSVLITSSLNFSLPVFFSSCLFLFSYLNLP